jgi:DNA-binding NarL/FixJ family response regulator
VTERSASTTVVLADAHAMVRAGLRLLVESLGDYRVVGEAGDGQDLLTVISRHRPRIAIAEIDLPVMNGLDALGQVRRHYPEVAFLMLVGRVEPSQVRAAMKQGAAGVVVKQGEPAELGLALKAVLKSQSFLSPAVSHLLLDRREATRVEDHAVLTHRQRQVLTLIGKGRSTKEIAGLLGVSVKTVETHRARLMSALGLYGTNALMRVALRWGLDGNEI